MSKCVVIELLDLQMNLLIAQMLAKKLLVDKNCFAPKPQNINVELRKSLRSENSRVLPPLDPSINLADNPPI